MAFQVGGHGIRQRNATEFCDVFGDAVAECDRMRVFKITVCDLEPPAIWQFALLGKGVGSRASAPVAGS